MSNANTIIQYDFPSGVPITYDPSLPIYVLGDEAILIGGILRIKVQRDHEPILNDDGEKIGVRQIACRFQLDRINNTGVSISVSPTDAKWSYLRKNPEGDFTVVGDLCVWDLGELPSKYTHEGKSANV